LYPVCAGHYRKMPDYSNLHIQNRMDTSSQE
jgi:hypothetical protein